MKEWKQAVAVLTVMTALFIGQATLTRVEFSGLRADMNAVHDDLRDEIRAVRDNQVEMQRAIGEMQRGLGRIEGYLFGLDAEPADSV